MEYCCYNFNFDILINTSQVNDKFKVYVCSGGHFECINNIAMYLPIDCKRVILRLHVTPEKPISYKTLSKKYGLPLDNDICNKFKVDQFSFRYN